MRNQWYFRVIFLQAPKDTTARNWRWIITRSVGANARPRLAATWSPWRASTREIHWGYDCSPTFKAFTASIIHRPRPFLLQWPAWARPRRAPTTRRRAQFPLECHLGQGRCHPFWVEALSDGASIQDNILNSNTENLTDRGAPNWPIKFYAFFHSSSTNIFSIRENFLVACFVSFREFNGFNIKFPTKPVCVSHREMLFFEFFQRRENLSWDLFYDIYDTRRYDTRIVNLKIIYYSTRFVEFFERLFCTMCIYIHMNYCK